VQKLVQRREIVGVSRSGNLLNALPVAGVRFGVLNHT
jgi:hypothetical protein